MEIDKNLEKVLLIGANGFLGRNIVHLYKSTCNETSKYVLVAADLKHNNIPFDISKFFIDITEPYKTRKTIMKISPEIIILTAAMTDVDQCEINRKLATKINAKGPENIINICRKTSSKLVFLSTDFIFDGSKKNGNYKEEDEPNPISHYGKTKYDAEILIMNANIESLICRTAVLYGWDEIKVNFITWVLEKLKNNLAVSIVTNQINSPTYAKNLAEIIINLIEKKATGIYHTAGRDALSRYQIAIKCAEIFNYNKNLINPINNLEQKAKRPENAGLDINKLRKFIDNDLKIYSLEDGLKDMKLCKDIYF